MSVNRVALRHAGQVAEVWSDRCVGGASAFLVAAIMTSTGWLWVPAVVIGLAALVLFFVGLGLGGRSS